MQRLAANVTHCCIALHVRAYPLHLLRLDARENGGVGAFAEEQRVAWGGTTNTRGWRECQRSTIKLRGAAIKPRVIWRSPDEDLTITLIRLLTGSKFSTWSSSYLEDAMTDGTVTAMSQDKLTQKS